MTESKRFLKSGVWVLVIAAALLLWLASANAQDAPKPTKVPEKVELTTEERQALTILSQQHLVRKLEIENLKMRIESAETQQGLIQREFEAKVREYAASRKLEGGEWIPSGDLATLVPKPKEVGKLEGAKP